MLLNFHYQNKICNLRQGMQVVDIMVEIPYDVHAYEWESFS